MTLVIDTVDVSSFAPDVGYEVGYSQINGGQGAYMLDGSQSVDELNVKAVLRIPLYPLTENQVSEILSLVMPEPIHNVQYKDPWKGVRTVRMIRSVTTQKFRGRGGDGSNYWTGTVLEFLEK